MNAEEKAAAAQYEEMQSALMPEVNYHYNAMLALQGLQQPSMEHPDAMVIIQASIAWSLLGLLRAKIREAG